MLNNKPPLGGDSFKVPSREYIPSSGEEKSVKKPPKETVRERLSGGGLGEEFIREKLGTDSGKKKKELPGGAKIGQLFTGYKTRKKEEKPETPEKLGALFSKKQTSRERWKVRQFWRGIQNPRNPEQRAYQKEYSKYLRHMPSNLRTEQEFVKWLEEDLVKLGQSSIRGGNLDKAIRKLDKERWKVKGPERTLMEKKLNIYKKMRGLTK